LYKQKCLKICFLENNDESDGDETHGDDSHDDEHGFYSGTTLLSRSAASVTALLMAAFF